MVILISSIIIESNAQELNENSPSGFFAFGGVGPAISMSDFGQKREVGLDLNTALSYRFKSGFFLRGMSDFASFKFDRGEIIQQVGAQTYDLSGTNRVISLNLSGGYSFSEGKVIPYAFAGLGTSFLSKPKIAVDEDQNIIDIESNRSGYFSTITGAGVDFVLNYSSQKENKNLFIIYLESFYTYVPGENDISPHTFQLLTFNVGVKTEM